MTPFYLMYGRHPRMPTEETDDILETTFLNHLFTIINEVSEQQEKA